MIRLYKICDGRVEEVADQKGDYTLETLAQADWIDTFETSTEELDKLRELLDFELPAAAEIEEIEASARSFVDQTGIHVHSLFLTPSHGRHKTVTVASILQSERLVTFRECDIADFRLLHLRVRQSKLRCAHVAELLVKILDQKVENHADTLEDIHRELEGVSRRVLEERGSELQEAVNQLAKLEDSNGKVRLCLMDTQRDISFLLRHLNEETALSETLRDVETLMNHTTFLFDKINFLMDSTQGFINIEQNQIIKTFSIAAVVFLPPTLIASIYGMNFEFMPELDSRFGYPAALILMVMSGFAPYWYFKRKGWLK